jgi:hypothetical protein
MTIINALAYYMFVTLITFIQIIYLNVTLSLVNCGKLRLDNSYLGTLDNATS